MQNSETNSRSIIRESLAWLLPEPIEMADCVVVDQSEPAAPNAKAILSIGRMGASAASLKPRPSFKIQYDYRVMPAAGHPRALLPSKGPRRGFAAMVAPRSQDVPRIKRIAAATLKTFPGLLSLATAPVRLSVPHESQVVTAMCQEFPAAGFGVEPGNQNARGRTTIKAIDTRGALVGIAKFVAHRDGRDGKGTERLAHEHAILTALGSFSSLKGRIPKPRAFVRGHIGDTLITDAFVGQPAPVRLTPPIREWLDRCRTPETTPVTSTALVRSLAAEVVLHRNDQVLAEATKRAMSVLAPVRVPRTVVHGDFMPWNIVLVNGEACVFDWEYGCLDGIPGWDEAFFIVRLGYSYWHLPPAQLIAELSALADSPPCPYDVPAFRAVAALTMVHIILRDEWDGLSERSSVVRQALNDMLASNWLR